MRKLIEALHILAQYFPNGLEESYFMGAEHDIVYFYLDCEQLPEDCSNGEKLVELGLHYDDSVDSWAMHV